MLSLTTNAELSGVNASGDALKSRSGFPCACAGCIHVPEHAPGYSCAVVAPPWKEYAITKINSAPNSAALPMRENKTIRRSRLKLTVCVMRLVKN